MTALAVGFDPGAGFHEPGHLRFELERWGCPMGNNALDMSTERLEPPVRSDIATLRWLDGDTSEPLCTVPDEVYGIGTSSGCVDACLALGEKPFEAWGPAAAHLPSSTDENPAGSAMVPPSPATTATGRKAAPTVIAPAADKVSSCEIVAERASPPRSSAGATLRWLDGELDEPRRDTPAAVSLRSSSGHADAVPGLMSMGVGRKALAEGPEGPSPAPREPGPRRAPLLQDHSQEPCRCGAPAAGSALALNLASSSPRKALAWGSVDVEPFFTTGTDRLAPAGEAAAPGLAAPRPGRVPPGPGSQGPLALVQRCPSAAVDAGAAAKPARAAANASDLGARGPQAPGGCGQKPSKAAAALPGLRSPAPDPCQLLKARKTARTSAAPRDETSRMTLEPKRSHGNLGSGKPVPGGERLLSTLEEAPTPRGPSEPGPLQSFADISTASGHRSPLQLEDGRPPAVKVTPWRPGPSKPCSASSGLAARVGSLEAQDHARRLQEIRRVILSNEVPLVRSLPEATDHTMQPTVQSMLRPTAQQLLLAQEWQDALASYAAGGPPKTWRFSL